MKHYHYSLTCITWDEFVPKGSGADSEPLSNSTNNPSHSVLMKAMMLD